MSFSARPTTPADRPPPARADGTPLSAGPLADFPPRRRHLPAAAAVIAAVYLAGVTDAWWPTPDSALYQGLGRSLARTGRYRFNGIDEKIVTPGLPVLIAGLTAVFGERFWPANLLMTACGLAALSLAFRTLRRLTDPRTAFAVVLATAGMYRYYDYSHLILTDAPFVLLFWLAAYGSVRLLEGAWGWAAVVGPLAAAAMVVRSPGVLVLGPWGAALLLERHRRAALPRRLLAAALTAGAAAVTTAVLLRIYPGYAEATGRGFSVPARLAEVARGLVALPDRFANTFLAQRSAWMWPVGALLVALAVAGGIVLWRRGRRVAPAACLLNVLAVCFLVGSVSVRARYMMALYPLLLWMMFEGLCAAVPGAFALLGRRGARPADLLAAATVFTVLLLGVNVPKLARNAFYYSTMGRLGRFHEVIDGGIYAELEPVAKFLRERFGPDGAVAARPDRVNMLHLLGGARTEPFKKVCPWNPWNADHAEEIFADLQARRHLRGIVFDPGDLDERFTRRFRRLLDAAPDLRCIRAGPTVRVYERIAPAATRPAGGGASSRPHRPL